MKTVGSILTKARQSQGLDYKKIHTDTKIPPKFLKALEEGDWSRFSSPVHIKGFLKNYASYLGLKVNDVLAFWRREYQNSNREQNLKNNIRPLNAPRMVITPGLVLAVVSVFSILLFFAYLFYQYHSFAGAPVLIVDEPPTDIATTETVLGVTGRTDRDAQVSINGQKVTLGEKGTFSVPLTLAEGVNTINIQAQNRMGRKSTVMRTVVVEKKEVAATESARPQSSKGTLDLEVEIGPHAAWLQVFADGEEVFEGLLVEGTKKTFTAGEKLLLKTGNAGSTRTAVNNQEFGPLGKEGEVAEREYKK